MPRGDRTGPSGMGPMTGRGAGFCTGNTAPGFMNRIGFGLGRRGRGFGFSQPYSVTPQVNSNSQKQMLEIRLNELKNRINQIEQTLESLEKA